MGGVHTSTLESHLDEFLWRQFHGKVAISAFDALLQHVSEWNNHFHFVEFCALVFN